jgi:hypothetical protein
MASKKRNPGAGGARVSRKNHVRSKDAANNSQRKGALQPLSGGTTRRSCAVYDGRDRIGVFVWNEATREALAWNAARRFIGRFGSFRAAAQAIGCTAATERQSAEARRRLADPHPPFASGLSQRFMGRVG